MSSSSKEGPPTDPPPPTPPREEKGDILAAINALSIKMENMSTKDDLKNAISEAVGPIKNKMVFIEESVGKSKPHSKTGGFVSK